MMYVAYFPNSSSPVSLGLSTGGMANCRRYGVGSNDSSNAEADLATTALLNGSVMPPTASAPSPPSCSTFRREISMRKTPLESPRCFTRSQHRVKEAQTVKVPSACGLGRVSEGDREPHRGRHQHQLD